MATLFAFPVCQSLKNKLHPRKTNTHTHTANKEKELLTDLRDSQAGEQWLRTLPGMEGERRHVASSEKEGRSLTPAVAINGVGRRTFSFTQTLLQLPRLALLTDVTHLKLHISSILFLTSCSIIAI